MKGKLESLKFKILEWVQHNYPDSWLRIISPSISLAGELLNVF